MGEELNNLVDFVKNSRRPLADADGEEVNWYDDELRLDFIKQCHEGGYVLVIGSEAVLRKDMGEGDSSRYILEKGKEKGLFNHNIESFAELEDDTSLNAKICKVIKSNYEDFQKNALDYLDPSLRLLLETKCFRLIITTAFDPILELALNKIWNMKIDVKNIFYGKAPVDKDLDLAKKGRSEFYDIDPTLYYAFGKAYKDDASYIFGVKDGEKILTIDRWLGIQKPQSLLEYIKNKKILAVGCKFDDWLFRFFWYILSQRPTNDTSSATPLFNIVKNGSVAVKLSTEDEERMKKYIQRSNNIRYYDDSRNFMSYIGPDIIEYYPPSAGELFISYASEDFLFAKDLYDSLCERNQNVWLDIRLIPGDLYNNRIRNAIKECSIFLPILSGQTMKDILTPPSEERFYRKEWKWAQEKFEESQKTRKLFVVIPIILKPYETKNNEYHKPENLLPCVYDASCFFPDKNLQISDLVDFIEKQKENR